MQPTTKSGYFLFFVTIQIGHRASRCDVVGVSNVSDLFSVHLRQTEQMKCIAHKIVSVADTMTSCGVHQAHKMYNTPTICPSDNIIF